MGDGEERNAILKQISLSVAKSEKGWLEELEHKAVNDTKSLTSLLIDAAIWEPRRLIGDFDVFLCHNGEDKPDVKIIAEQLLEQGYLPWLDVWELRPGLPWQPLLEEQIERVKTAAVFVGSNGIGPWQKEELNSLLSEFHRRGCIIIPVILPKAPVGLEPKKRVDIPPFLRNRTWVNFQIFDPNPLEQLIWGITGKRM